jgi:apolipoprotein N-acyltransferase
LRDATTLATRLGEAPEWVAAAALLTMLALGLGGGRPATPPTVPVTTTDRTPDPDPDRTPDPTPTPEPTKEQDDHDAA